MHMIFGDHQQTEFSGTSCPFVMLITGTCSVVRSTQCDFKTNRKANRSHWTYDNQLNAISVASHNRRNSLHNDRVASIFSRQRRQL